ncbi:DUF6059 family protein [Saccharothrix saharensis]|uniref:DUF6059 family protein n=1 Tax=Saccharothrix saharensis TaxID=571190 RepID=UPI0036C9E5DD
MVWHALLRGLISLGVALWPHSEPPRREGDPPPPRPGGDPPPGHPERWSPPSAEEWELWRRSVE